MNRDKIVEFIKNVRPGLLKDNISFSINCECLDDLRTMVYDRLGLVLNNSQLVDYLALKCKLEMIHKKPFPENINQVINLSNRCKPKRRIIKTQLEPDYAGDDVV